jgi:hypothetical protein
MDDAMLTGNVEEASTGLQPPSQHQPPPSASLHQPPSSVLACQSLPAAITPSHRRLATGTQRISFSASFAGLSVMHEHSGLLFPRSVAYRARQWGLRRSDILFRLSVVIGYLSAAVYCLFICFSGHFLSGQQDLVNGLLSAGVYILLAARLLILATMVLLAVNLSLVRLIAACFQVWLLIWQAGVYCTSLLLILTQSINSKPDHWSTLSSRIPINVLVIALPLVSIFELILSDVILPPHHRALVANAAPTTIIFLCCFAGSVFRWPGSFFAILSDASLEIFRLPSGMAISLSPRGLLIGASFTVSIIGFKIAWLLILKRHQKTSVLTILSAPYDIRVHAFGKREVARVHPSTERDALLEESIHGKPTKTVHFVADPSGSQSTTFLDEDVFSCGPKSNELLYSCEGLESAHGGIRRPCSLANDVSTNRISQIFE